mgnify:CR=1 FL=1
MTVARDHVPTWVGGHEGRERRQLDEVDVEASSDLQNWSAAEVLLSGERPEDDARGSGRDIHGMTLAEMDAADIRPVVDACLALGAHYLDITGEIAVFEACAAVDPKAKDAGIMVMPGVGFDVVPSDCLARHLKDRLPTATDLSLAFYGMGRMSHGTQATMTMNIGKGGAVRRDGKIMPVPAAWRTREIDFGETKKTGVTIPWGDVSTAFYSTGIPNIEVFTVVPPSALKLMKLSRYIGPMLASGPLQRYLQGKIPPGGPSDQERARGKTLLWGEASDTAGNRVEARLQTPEGYTITALAALNITQKILEGNFTPGFQTPSKAYGADLVLEIAGTKRDDG